MQNSSKKKNNIYSKLVKRKSQKIKELYHNKYKTYSNLLSTLLNKAKEKQSTKFFNENIKYIKNTWIGIESLVSTKHKNNDTPSIFRNDEKYINDPIAIANTFNNFFTSTAETAQSKIKFSNKSLRSFSSTKNYDSFLITATNKEENSKITSSLNIQEQISKHLVTICNLFFSTGIFPTIMKTAKVIPNHKKDFKLELSNCRPISLRYNLDKLFGKLKHSRLIEFLEERQILYYKNFVFEKISQQTMPF